MRVPLWLGWLCCAAVALPPLGRGDSVVRQVVSPDRIRISAGEFQMGASPEDQAYARRLCEAEPVVVHGEEPASAQVPASDPCPETLFAAEGPARRVHLPAYAIDRLEVSVADYDRCRGALRCAPNQPWPTAADAADQESLWTLPVVGVRYDDAVAYCEFVGGRLPTEAEWERAARADSARRFPWGEQWNRSLAHHGGALGRDILGRAVESSFGYLGPAPVDSYASGHSAYGLRNMAGNVWEWTADRYSGPERVTLDEPAAGHGGSGAETRRVVRGGSWRSAPHWLRVTARRGIEQTAHALDLGFRCAYDLTLD